MQLSATFTSGTPRMRIGGFALHQSREFQLVLNRSECVWFTSLLVWRGVRQTLVRTSSLPASLGRRVWGGGGAADVALCGRRDATQHVGYSVQTEPEVTPPAAVYPCESRPFDFAYSAEFCSIIDEPEWSFSPSCALPCGVRSGLFLRMKLSATSRKRKTFPSVRCVRTRKISAWLWPVTRVEVSRDPEGGGEACEAQINLAAASALRAAAGTNMAAPTAGFPARFTGAVAVAQRGASVFTAPRGHALFSAQLEVQFYEA